MSHNYNRIFAYCTRVYYTFSWIEYFSSHLLHIFFHLLDIYACVLRGNVCFRSFSQVRPSSTIDSSVKSVFLLLTRVSMRAEIFASLPDRNFRVRFTWRGRKWCVHSPPAVCAGNEGLSAPGCRQLTPNVEGRNCVLQSLP